MPDWHAATSVEKPHMYDLVPEPSSLSHALQPERRPIISLRVKRRAAYRALDISGKIDRETAIAWPRYCANLDQ